MDFTNLRKQAKLDAKEFLEKDSEYRMGYIEAELPHPVTRRLSQTYQEDIAAGVKLIFTVDDQMAQRASETLTTEAYAQFADAVRQTIAKGGRVIFSGCGSSGRLAMRLEQSWRNGIRKLMAIYPRSKKRIEKALEQVGSIQTGGEYAVIRAVESFEDSTALGEKQAQEWNLTKKDLLVGVTATGETTSILGTAMEALRKGAQVYMLICSDPTPLLDKMERTRVVYTHKNCRYLLLPCGAMALTGSTRMQSSSFEQFAAAVALEGALCDIAKIEFQGYGYYGAQFKAMTENLLGETCVSLIAQYTKKEQAVYEQGGLMTLFSDEYLLDVLTDTTERAPTFMTPPFCSADMLGQAQSWAFVKNPTCDTLTAWEKCFLRTPRCIGWKQETYEQLGLTERQIEKIPDISLRSLHRFIIGNERDIPREKAEPSFALWADGNEPPECFYEQARRYMDRGAITLQSAGVQVAPTAMDMFEHLALKMMLNTLSTGVMAAMGRISGNWMTCLAMSNKKLVDRSARIVSDLCGVPYEQALEELYFCKLKSEALNIIKSPTQMAIETFGMKE